MRYSSSLFMVIYGGTLRLCCRLISRRLSGWALLKSTQADTGHVGQARTRGYDGDGETLQGFVSRTSRNDALDGQCEG